MKLSEFREIVGKRRNSPSWEYLVVIDRDIGKLADELLAVVDAAKKVSEFLDGRWTEDHAYRDRHLKPLRDALAALDKKLETI